jgi:hypothetical protein
MADDRATRPIPSRPLPPRPIPPRPDRRPLPPRQLAGAAVDPPSSLSGSSLGVAADSSQTRITARPPGRPRSPRPDSRPMRTVVGLLGIAAVSAFATSVASKGTTSGGAAPVAQAVETAAPSVIHVTRYIQLRSGQTPPPDATVKVGPTPSPRVVVVTQTRQSGLP